MTNPNKSEPAEKKFARYSPYLYSLLKRKGKTINWEQAYQDKFPLDYQDKNKLFFTQLTAFAQDDAEQLAKLKISASFFEFRDFSFNTKMSWYENWRDFLGPYKHQAIYDYLYKIALADNKLFTTSAHKLAVAAAFNQQNDLIKLLKDNPNILQEESGEMLGPLHLASLNGQTQVMEALLIADKNIVNAKNICQRTPLFFTVFTNFVDGIEILVVHEAALDPVDQFGYTPLLYALEFGNNEAACCLIKRGAALDNVKDALFPPLYLAAKKANKVMMRYLIEHGAKIDIAGERNPLVGAYESGNLEAITMILERKPEIKEDLHVAKFINKIVNDERPAAKVINYYFAIGPINKNDSNIKLLKALDATAANQIGLNAEQHARLQVKWLQNYIFSMLSHNPASLIGNDATIKSLVINYPPAQKVKTTKFVETILDEIKAGLASQDDPSVWRKIVHRIGTISQLPEHRIQPLSQLIRKFFGNCQYEPTQASGIVFQLRSKLIAGITNKKIKAFLGGRPIAIAGTCYHLPRGIYEIYQELAKIPNLHASDGLSFACLESIYAIAKQAEIESERNYYFFGLFDTRLHETKKYYREVIETIEGFYFNQPNNSFSR